MNDNNISQKENVQKLSSPGITIGYFGKEGSNTHFAARAIYEGEFISFPSVQSLFQAVEKGTVKYGVAPIENSVEGTVGVTNDLLYRNSLYITAELYTKITHCLIARPGVKMEQISKVISHPQALGQCSQYIEKMGFEQVQFQDTASAVSSLSKEQYSTYGAIGSRFTAELYGMEVLEEDMGDFPDNHTRFVSVSASAYVPTGQEKKMKSSIVVSLENRPGSLEQILRIFSRNGINLTRIESRPVKFSPWKYIFFLDSEYVENSPKVFTEVQEGSKSFKMLGIYPMAEF